MTKVTISEKQAHAMAQVCLDLHDALGCKWGDNPYLTISQLKAAAQPAPVEPAAWMDALKDAFFDGFTSVETYNDTRLNSPEEAWANYEPPTPPAARRKPVDLTNDEINNIANGCHLGKSVQGAIREALDKYKEKNA